MLYTANLMAQCAADEYAWARKWLDKLLFARSELEERGDLGRVLALTKECQEDAAETSALYRSLREDN